ncbi:DUF2628 domain-containing protein, partial [Rhizobium ruizarguesonis]
MAAPAGPRPGSSISAPPIPCSTSATVDETRTIRDGFTLLGFLFPWLWLLANRLWLHAAAAF